jgi:hypothetical protein
MSPVKKWCFCILFWLAFIGLTVAAIFQQMGGGATGVLLSMVFSIAGIVVGMIPIFLPETVKGGTQQT